MNDVGKLELGAAITVASSAASLAHWRYDAKLHEVALAAALAGAVTCFVVKDFMPARNLASSVFSLFYEVPA